MTKPLLRAGMRSFLSFLGSYKLRLTIVIFSFTLANLCLAVIPLFIGKLVGSLAVSPIHGHAAVVYAWVLAGLSLGHMVLWHASELLYVVFVKSIGYRYENLLFRQVIRRPYPYFVDKFTGKVSSYITTISQEMRDFVENFCYNYTGELVGLISLVIILASVNWQTGAIFVVGLSAMLFVGRYSIRNSKKYEQMATDVQATKNGKLIDAIANFVNVKTFRKETVETNTIISEQTKTLRSSQRSFLWSMFFWGTMGTFVRLIIWPACIGLNVYLFIHHQVSIGQLTTMLSALLLFSTTIWEAIWYFSQFNLKLARIEEAHQYLFGASDIVREAAAEPTTRLPQFSDSLSFHNLTFAYPDKSQTTVLRRINLTFKKGEKVGIVGHSGSGKTTLTKVLLGYYDVPDQSLLIDGHAVDSSTVAKLVAYVPQDTALFHRSLAENIAYATDREVTQADVVKAAKQAHAHEFIVQISDGYDALVGERGVKLSGGQRQRIAIARAFLDDKPILVLDEATSALDSQSELLVQAALEKLWEEKTVIAIAHRLSTLRHMDRIIVMADGKVIEQGSHAELIVQKGEYAKLWAHQSGGFLDD